MAKPPSSDTPDNSHLWDIEEVAEFLSLGKRTISRMVANDEIPFVRVSNSLRFPPWVIIKWINEKVSDSCYEKPDANDGEDKQGE